MGFATEGTEGTEGIRPQVGSVVSVILCGLSCPCVLFILSMVMWLVGMPHAGTLAKTHPLRCAQWLPRQAWVAWPRKAWPWRDARARIFRTCPRERGHATRPPPPKGGPIIVIPSDAVRSRAKHRGSRNPFFSVAKRHRFCCCGTALDGRRSTFTPIGEYAAALRQAPCGSAV